MDTLMNSKLRNNIKEVIKQHIELFDDFDHIYLFGSILDENKTPNDIDLLLIYSIYSLKILNDLNTIRFVLENEIKLPLDLTVISVEEEKEMRFLDKLNFKHLKLK